MSTQTVGLSSPVYQFQRVLAYTLGQSASMIVSDLDSSTNTVNVIASSTAAAQALAQIVKPEQSFGNLKVAIAVKDINGNTYQPTQSNSTTDMLVESAKTALINNPLIFDVRSVTDFSGKLVAGISVVPTAIQFWNDNLANPSSFTTLLAENGFDQVLVEQFKVFSEGKHIGNN
jgi:hypothetical protein